MELGTGVRSVMDARCGVPSDVGARRGMPSDAGKVDREPARSLGERAGIKLGTRDGVRR